MYKTQKTKPGEIQAIKLQMLQDKFGAVVETFGRCTFATYEKDGRPCMALFIGKQKNTYSHLVYQSWAKLAADMLKHKEHEIEREERQANFSENVKAGDIFYTSWGYEQTNVDFYQVIERKGQFVTIREIKAEIAYMNGDMDGAKIAKPGEFIGRPMRKKIQCYSNKPFLSISSYAAAYPWDGTPMSFSSWG